MAINKIINKSGKTAWEVNWREPTSDSTTGRRRKKRFDLKKDAEAYYGAIQKAKKEKRYGEVFSVKKGAETTFSELADLYEQNFDNQRSWETLKKHVLELLRKEFGDRRLADITVLDLELFRNKRLKTPIIPETEKKEAKPRTKATVNRELSVLRHMLSKAVEWEMLDTSPFSKAKRLFYKENNARTRYLDEKEIKELLKACNKHIYPVVLMALHTGMRRGELLGLKWEQIKDGLIYLRETKTDRPRQIPVNQMVKEVLKHQRNKHGLKSRYVFCRKDGTRFYEIKKSFKAAVKTAKIENFTFHDLRHTFASHLVMNGVSLKVVQELLGHTSIQTTMRYAHLSPEHHQAAVKSLEIVTRNIPAVKPKEQDKVAHIKPSISRLAL